MKIRHLQAGDEDQLRAAAHLFDKDPISSAVQRFLSDPSHHLLVAYDGAFPAGFVSGVEMTHPDKGTEMFLYELAVDERYRGQGIGKSLVNELSTLARERGCYGMWVLTDGDNTAAIATYRSAGGATPMTQLMLSWTFAGGC